MAQDSGTIPDERLDALIAASSLEDKVRLLAGATAWSTYPLESAGLRRMVLSDGPVGVRGERWDGSDPSANLPSPTAIAASWDVRLVERLGRLLAAEARRKGVDMLLAPTVNLHRSPLGGRHFECYSEDPLLTGRIGTAYVRGVQSGGVSTCVKHFVANDSETERMSYDARIDERTMREVYLAPFEAIVHDGGAWSVMAAYNRVDGVTMTENALLDDVLKGEWGWDGVVVSDWTATRSTVESANAGTDLTMPGPEAYWGDKLLAAVREGDVSEERIDEKVRRLLRLGARVGALEGYAGAAEPITLGADEIASTIREAAARGFVLARNQPPAAEPGGPASGPADEPAGGAKPLLPLDSAGLRKVAVIGPGAEAARTQGGGSATVFPAYTVSPLDGIRTALARTRTEVVHAVGAKASPLIPAYEGEITVRFLGDGDAELGREQRTDARMLYLGEFGDGVPAGEVRVVEATATITAREAGDHAIGVAGVGHLTVRAGTHTLVDEALTLPEGAEPFLGVVRPPQRVSYVRLDAGEQLALTVRYDVAGSSGLAAFRFGHEEPARSEDDELAYAESLAADADAVIVIVGTTAEIESEGFDRESLALPGRQDELVARVCAANPRTVVVVNSGSPVELPWAERPAAVLLSWFGGQEFGNALADVLFGAVEPGGRLPTTWPVVAADCPVLSTTPDAEGVLAYAEGLHLGYRAWQRAGRTPRYPFGHGLGYTTWEYAEPVVQSVSAGAVGLVVPVRNAGDRLGRTVVQAYASRPGSAVERPVSWLVGFAVVEAEPGETVEAAIAIGPRAFAHWDVGTYGWALEPGEFEIRVGGSSADLGAPIVVDPSA